MATVSGVYGEEAGVISLASAADYSSTDPNCLVKASTTDDTAEVAGAGALAIGVRLNKPNTGEAMLIQTRGIAMVIVGAAGVTAGDKVKADSAGHVVTASSAGDIANGIALRTGVDNDIVPVLLCKFYIHA